MTSLSVNMTNLAAFRGAVEKDITGQVVGFDIMSILMVLLPILVEQLQGCLSKKSKAELVDQLASNDLVMQTVVLSKLRGVLRESGDKMNLSSQAALTKACCTALADKPRTEGMLTESAQMQWSLA